MPIQKPIRYDRHARRRMKWRRISDSNVEETLNSPDKIESTFVGRMNAFKRIGERLIKVTYRESDNEVLVISAVDKSD